jgi:hypothetical protein
MLNFTEEVDVEVGGGVCMDSSLQPRRPWNTRSENTTICPLFSMDQSYFMLKYFFSGLSLNQHPHHTHTKHNSTCHCMILLIFPKTRPSRSIRFRISTLDLVYRSTDSLPYNYTNITLTPISCLHLPLTVLILPNSLQVKLPKKAKEMIGSDLFVYNFVPRLTRYKDPSLFSRYFKYASNTIIRGIASNSSLFNPSFKFLLNSLSSYLLLLIHLLSQTILLIFSL